MSAKVPLERTHKKNYDWQYLILVISLTFFLSVAMGSYGKATLTRELTPQIHFLVLLEAISTAATLLFIWASVNEGREDRRTMVDEARMGREFQLLEYGKERRKERLREQLLFYSPLVGFARHKKYGLGPTNAGLYQLIEEKNSTFEIYAETATKRLLRYFYLKPRLSIEETKDFLQEFRTIVLMDFSVLRIEYLHLMGDRDPLGLRETLNDARPPE